MAQTNRHSSAWIATQALSIRTEGKTYTPTSGIHILVGNALDMDIDPINDMPRILDKLYRYYAIVLLYSDQLNPRATSLRGEKHEIGGNDELQIFVEKRSLWVMKRLLKDKIFGKTYDSNRGVERHLQLHPDNLNEFLKLF